MEPLAVVGIGCRFPQANNPAAFWQLLRDGREAIAPIPEDRWQVKTFYDPDPATPGKMHVSRGGFLGEIDKFDADFFGMSTEEVEHTDPQQRLFLEVAWEALENAGIAPASLAKSQTGVFTGLCTVDYHRLLYKNYERIGSHSGTGTTMCITANRLSYLLDLQGPSIAIDAACSSSLVTVHLACQSLRSGESDLCLAGGINLILSPDSTISSTKTGLLSAEGRCKSFDAAADGYARGEGCGVIVLKRLWDAINDGDNILALIRGSAVNHNGLSNSLSAPNGLAQQNVIRQALKNARVQPHEVSYIDAHAVGTGIGDAIEFRALQAVYSEGRKTDSPCGVGSVKTNIGHLEAAAGISALIKVILALQHEAIPPHLHLEKLNPYISLNDSFYIPTQLQAWTSGEKSRLAGVSAFGFGGTNAHVILGEAPLPKRQRKASLGKRPLHLVTLSAKNELALRQLAQKYDSFLESQPQVDLADLGYTANTGRKHFKHRLCTVAESNLELRHQLAAFIARQPSENLMAGQLKSRKRPQLAWLFPGEGFSFEIATLFYQTQPTFRQAVEACEAIARSALSQPLFKSPSGQVLDRSIAQFASEYGLARLWHSWGIKPQAVIGYGVGELVAATIAGVFSLEAALRLIIAHCSQPIIAYESTVSAINYAPPQITLISSQQKLAGESIATPEYWLRYWQQSDSNPEYPEALANFPLVLSMGMKPSAVADNARLLGLSGNPQTSWQEILHNLGKLYVRGVAIDWQGFDRDYQRRRLALPTYPFQRQRYWFTPSVLETPGEPMPQLFI